MDTNSDMTGYVFTLNEELPAASTVNMARGETPLDQLPLAMAYVPMQRFTQTYDSAQALQRGTIFPDLDLPFCGRGVR